MRQTGLCCCKSALEKTIFPESFRDAQVTGILIVRGEDGGSVAGAPTGPEPGSSVGAMGESKRGTMVTKTDAPCAGGGGSVAVAGPARSTEQAARLNEQRSAGKTGPVLKSKLPEPEPQGYHGWLGKLCRKFKASCTLATSMTLMLLATDTASA
jgi:hypothetical protein